MLPPVDRPSRRNRTRQRERILELLRGADSHPTANWIHETLRPEFPRLSLGTVYRNLEVLVSEGLVKEVPTPGSAARYDGNPEPHHHFVCDRCGGIDDLQIRITESLEARVRRKYGLRPRRFQIDFYGLCRACSGRGDSAFNH
jgi:Fur family peroxide stress response transcriptional regulator